MEYQLQNNGFIEAYRQLLIIYVLSVLFIQSIPEHQNWEPNTIVQDKSMLQHITNNAACPGKWPTPAVILSQAVTAAPDDSDLTSKLFLSCTLTFILPPQSGLSVMGMM